MIDHLSVEACFARRGRGGAQLVEANGFIGAAFRHRTSRAGDPQLHTHVVVPNLVEGSDGRWSAPDGRQLYLWQKAAGTLYRSALRTELAPLGFAWDFRRNGLSELRDVPKAILRAFSKRRTDIETAMEVRGTASQKAAETATLDTRERKPVGGTQIAVLREGWLEQLSAIELPDGEGGSRPATVADLTDTLGPGRAHCSARGSRLGGGVPGPGREGGGIARRLADRRTATVRCRSSRREGVAPHPARIELFAA